MPAARCRAGAIRTARRNETIVQCVIPKGCTVRGRGTAGSGRPGRVACAATRFVPHGVDHGIDHGMDQANS